MSSRTREILVIVGFALCVYVLAYIATVQRGDMFRTGIGPWKMPPEYRIFGWDISHPAVHLAFAPVHWLDVRIRKDYWLANQ